MVQASKHQPVNLSVGTHDRCLSPHKKALTKSYWSWIYWVNRVVFVQEEQNRGKPNWEHLNDELHVLITVEDSENRAKLKLERAVEEVKKLLTVVSSLLNYGLGGKFALWWPITEKAASCWFRGRKQFSICFPVFLLQLLQYLFSFCNVSHILLSVDTLWWHWRWEDDEWGLLEDWRRGILRAVVFKRGKVCRVSKTDEGQGELKLYTVCLCVCGVCTIFTFTYLQIYTISKCFLLVIFTQV